MRPTSSLRKSNQQGFTLVELVTVIIILGILAAVAVPKMISMTATARVAKMKALAGTFASQANSAQAKWLTGGRPGYLYVSPTTAITYINGAVTAGTLQFLIDYQAVPDVRAYYTNSYVAGGTMTVCDTKAASYIAGDSSTFGCNGGAKKCSFTYTASPDGQMSFSMDTSRLTEENCT